MMLMGDDRLHLTDEEHRERGARAFAVTQEGVSKAHVKLQHRVLGAKGLCLPNEVLKYTSPNNLFVVPVAHSILYGMVASFVAHVLRKVPAPSRGGAFPDDCITYEQRACISARADHIVVTSEFGKKYKCVVKYKGSYRMEDWLHFVETFSLYIFLPGTLSPLLSRMWELLQVVVHHYFRGINFSEETRRVAAESILEYARLVELHFPATMCTYNMHMVACRLPRQEAQRGSAAREMEFIVERTMQDFKVRVGRHNSKNPEVVFMNNLLLARGLAKLVKKHPDLPTFLHLSGDKGLANLTGPLYDIVRAPAAAVPVDLRRSPPL